VISATERTLTWCLKSDPNFYETLVCVPHRTLIVDSDIGYRVTSTRFFYPLTKKFGCVSESINRYAFLD